MATCARSEAMSWPGWISSRVATLASRSAKRESAEERMTRGIFGRSSRASFAYFDPASSCWKTCQATFLSGLETFSETWPDSGTTRNGSAYELRISERPTCESACSSWPTATPWEQNESAESWEKRKAANKAKGYDGNGMGTPLDMVATHWPTARREDWESAGNHPDATDSLTGATKNWKTPHGMSNRDFRGKVGGCGGGEFALQANHWTSPQSHDAAAGNPARVGRFGTEHGGRNLTDDVTLWRTPDCPSGGSRTRSEEAMEAGHDHQVTLDEQTRLWQTRATDSFRSRGGDRKDEQGLDQQARMFPTPAERDHRTPKKRGYQDRSDSTKGEQLQNFVEHSLQDPLTPAGPTSSESAPTSRRRLNPRFVEWLMGFPPGWTEIP